MYEYLYKCLLPVLTFVGIMPLAGNMGPGTVGGTPPDDDNP